MLNNGRIYPKKKRWGNFLGDNLRDEVKRYYDIIVVSFCYFTKGNPSDKSDN